MDDFDDVDFELPDDDESAVATRISKFLDEIPTLRQLANTGLGGEIKSPAKVLANAKEFEATLEGVNLENFKRDGYTITPAFLKTYKSSLETMKESLRNKYLPQGASEEDIDRFARILTYNTLVGEDNPKAAAERLLLRMGVNYSNPNGSAVRSATYPVKKLKDSYLPAYSDLIAPAFSAIDKLNDFFSGSDGTIPEALNIDDVDLNFIQDSKDFSDLYKAISVGIVRHSDTKIQKEILGANAILPMTVTKSEIQSGAVTWQNMSLKDFKSKLIFNLPLIFMMNNKDEISETIFHEFAHSLHRALDLGFGPRTAAGRLSIEYANIAKIFVTEYGKTSHAEHFSETFSKYMTTGQAPAEWLDFMKRVGIIKG